MNIVSTFLTDILFSASQMMMSTMILKWKLLVEKNVGSDSHHINHIKALETQSITILKHDFYSPFLTKVLYNQSENNVYKVIV